MPTPRSLTTLALLVGLASVARGEHGSPGVNDPFDADDVVPTNVLVPLLGVNGVPYGLPELEALGPRLVTDSHSIPLRVVDAFDDMEGHAKPFPDDGGGYGDSVILLAPRRTLAPNTRYAFTIGTGSGAVAYFRLSTGSEADRKAPEWQKAPFLELEPPKADEPLLPSRIMTAVGEPSNVPLYFIVDLESREQQARPKRMIAVLNVPSAAERDCGYVRVWDHARNVHVDDTDSDLGRRYVATLTAVDAAGNRRRAPGAGIPIVWSGGLVVCNRPNAKPVAAANPRPPQWLDQPVQSSALDKHFIPADDHGTAYEHSLRLPVEISTVSVVELTVRRSKAPFTSYRRVGLLWPTKAAPGAAASPQGKDNCVEPLITNADREKVMPPDAEPVSVQVALIDALGRRLEHPGPALDVSNLNPQRSRIRVCATARVAK